MVQAKINAFFKPSSAARAPPPLSDPFVDDDACGAVSGSKRSEITVTYKRRYPNPNSTTCNADDEVEEVTRSENLSSSRETVSKKKNYVQYHLELGQSDFSLHSCSVCGLMYACGDDEDEKLHKAFHKNYSSGIQYKAWRRERVVSTSCGNGDKILLVQDGDPPHQKHQVKEVVKVMERELDFTNEQLHKLCKVYLFISSHRIVGCLVAEPIRAAYKVVSPLFSCNTSDDSCKNKSESVSPEAQDNDAKKRRMDPNLLQFGSIKFQREVTRKARPHGLNPSQLDSGAIVCEEEAVPAVCGIKAIWVVPSQRRKRIASQLLDAARQSFCDGRTLGLTQCAFSPPTFLGKALISGYTRSHSFLVYKSDCLGDI